MEPQGSQTGEVHVDSDNARAGSTPNVVRWVLGISLVAAIILMSAIWMFGAASHNAAETAGGNTPETPAEQAAQSGDEGRAMMDGTDELTETPPPSDAVDTPLQTIEN